ncbi:hypothetical protein [Legionella quateirensis]|uniref:hypothetical protein n=1 Tax=Legionella quateirensis TaxID=45072 RepID=UPI000B270088|nr:hypothetical protein [Legionella quateirensis]
MATNSIVSPYYASLIRATSGIGVLKFPVDLMCLLPLSITILYMSQIVLNPEEHKEITFELESMPT